MSASSELDTLTSEPEEITLDVDMKFAVETIEKIVDVNVNDSLVKVIRSMILKIQSSMNSRFRMYSLYITWVQ